MPKEEQKETSGYGMEASEAEEVVSKLFTQELNQSRVTQRAGKVIKRKPLRKGLTRRLTDSDSSSDSSDSDMLSSKNEEIKVPENISQRMNNDEMSKILNSSAFPSSVGESLRRE